ncbi:hypothetical protein GIB67_026359 [Kingdonia uniflora]|uniref:Uncharacterized protein n=1 Tax=Kingdonia uniflora TaxID=39325 RepID=A0A7J7P622_9MAGN|nr:hypothetical protein GIB67_026359 [Kingdonia uniflora]
MESEEAIIKVEKEEETIKCEVKDGCNPEVKKPSDGVRVHGTRRSYNVRTQNRARLRLLLDKLMKNHSWKETCGVLSVLLKGTRMEEYRVKNRDKYWIKVGDKIETVRFFHCYKRGVDHPMVFGNAGKHLERNKTDKDSKFRLILVESRIHRLDRYYKRTKKLPPTWKYL